MKRWRLMSLPKTLPLLALLLCLFQSAFASSPAPKSKQLCVGFVTSGAGDIPTNQSFGPTARKWVADRFGFWASSLGPGYAAMIDSMKVWNPSFKITTYDLADRHYQNIAAYEAMVPPVHFEDTTRLKAWAAKFGVALDTMLFYATDTIILNVGGFGPDTTIPGQMLHYHMFAANQRRIAFNPHSTGWGNYCWYIFDSIMTSSHLDGIFLDEWGNLGNKYDYARNADVNDGSVPLGPNVSMISFWPFGYASYWVRGWQSISHPAPGVTGTVGGVPTQAQLDAVRDSVGRKWNYEKWFKVLSDSMKAHGKIFWPNYDGTGGYSGFPAQWDHELRHSAVISGAYSTGEYQYLYPSDYHNYPSLRLLVKNTRGVIDSVQYHGIHWLRCGQYDNDNGINLDRSQMNVLGLMLEVESQNHSVFYPEGRSTMYLPCHNNGQTSFYFQGTQTYGNTTYADTLSLWNDAWGKLFGSKVGNTADSVVFDSSLSGTDPAGQAYRVDRIAYKNPNKTSDTLTLVIGRIARGGAVYDSASSSVNVTLPGSASSRWFPLRSRNHVVSWDGPLAGGSVIKIANGHFQIFSRDTVLSNTGSSSSNPTDSIPPSKVNDLGVVPGSSPSQLVLSWTAPGNDGTVGTALGYDIGYSVDSITAATWPTSAVIHVGNVIAPAVSGIHQTVTLTSSNGLLGGTKYWVALKAYDAASNYATLSNVPSAVTNSPPPAVDTIPPARVIDLGCAPGAASAQLVLTWTAPGNNGSVGRATGYEIGYSTDSITDANWSTSAVTQVGNLVVPAVAGTHQSLTLTSTNGILASTKYWVGLKAFDSAGNYATLSNRPSATTRAASSATDTVPPAKVTDLACVTGPSPAQLVLSWTAPGNNGTTGLAAGYEVGFSVDSITDALWPTSAVNQVGYLVTPLTAGSRQTLTLTASQGLLAGTKYWVGLKAYDSAGNYAPLSNVSSATTSVTIETGGDVCIARALSPANGALLTSAHPALTVQNTTCAEPGPHTYFFQVAQDTFFTNPSATSPRVAEGTQLTSWTVTNRLLAGHYFWRVQVDTFPFGDNAYFDLRAQTIAFPNPVSLSKAAQVTFSDLPQGANLLITSVSGDVVKRWTSLPGGDIKWNAQNESGNVVSPGTYLWYLENSSTRGKIIILP